MLLGRRLNQAVREVLLRTRLYVVTDTVALATSDNEYDLATELDPDPLLIVAIVNSDSYPLERETVATILDLRRGSPSASAGSIYRYALQGAHTLMVYPTPNASGALTVHYVPKPTEMSSGSHDPATATYGNIPAEFHDALEFYALYRLASYDDDGSSQIGTVYQQQFERELAKIRAQVYRRGGRATRARVGRRAYVSPDPSRT